MPPPPPPRHAVLYIRCDGPTTAQALDRLTRYATARGHRIVARYTDPAAATTPLAQRATWSAQVLPTLTRADVTLLVADAASELATSAEEQAALHLVLAHRGIHADYRIRPHTSLPRSPGGDTKAALP